MSDPWWRRNDGYDYHRAVITTMLHPLQWSERINLASAIVEKLVLEGALRPKKQRPKIDNE